eukprot:TRINITY_DN2378_c0_g1_i1.p1 TRINITY_DN2378_c0_g1~~TRINITY_DN2378_c0_g1_i1.p1  ORF type:complete len:149 (+),score=44.10 TRINITY_DN2378_c0_g1_i1:6-452(+)
MKVVLALVALLSVAAVIEAESVTHIFSYRGGKGSFYNARNKKTYSAYSGDQAHYNREQYQQVKSGPLPVGKWKVIQSHTDHKDLGTYAHILRPVNVPKSFGRVEFSIHKDNDSNNHTGSSGCIIVEEEGRAAVKEGDFVIVRVGARRF